MGIEFNENRIREFIDDIRNFKTNLIQFDVERVKRESMKQFAVEMTDIVIRILRSHPDINAPATSGPYDSGPGPSISTKEAWRVRKLQDGYALQPVPSVTQRAISLNDGLGRIEPTGDGPLRWYVNGVPKFAEYLPAEKTHDGIKYWQTAFNYLIQSDKMTEIGEDELQAEAARAFNEPTQVTE